MEAFIPACGKYWRYGLEIREQPSGFATAFAEMAGRLILS
jgi:hypothetical protein